MHVVIVQAVDKRNLHQPFAPIWTKSKSNVNKKLILQRSELIWVTKQMRKSCACFSETTVPVICGINESRRSSSLNLHHLEIQFQSRIKSSALVCTSYSHLFHSHYFPSRCKQTPVTPFWTLPSSPRSHLTPTLEHPAAETRWGLSAALIGAVSAHCGSLLLFSKHPGCEMCVQCSGAELVSVREVCGVCHLAGGELTHCLQCLGHFHTHCHFSK